MGKPYPSYQPTRCTAHSKRTGEPCGNWSIRGGNVCRKHGGSVGAVRRRATERLNEASYALAGMLLEIATSGTSEAVRLAAIKDALDRAGLRPRDEVSIEVKPWEQAIDRIVVDVADARVPEPDPLVQAHILKWNAEATEPSAWDRSSIEPELLEAEVEAELVERRSPAPAPVEPTNFNSRPPARFDPEGLGRDVAPRRRR